MVNIRNQIGNLYYINMYNINQLISFYNNIIVMCTISLRPGVEQWNGDIVTPAYGQSGSHIKRVNQKGASLLSIVIWLWVRQKSNTKFCANITYKQVGTGLKLCRNFFVCIGDITGKCVWMCLFIGQQEYTVRVY